VRQDQFRGPRARLNEHLIRHEQVAATRVVRACHKFLPLILRGVQATVAITKSAGFTTTERMLAELCDQTFLRLWSYPNPHKDDGHELCDLLVVFNEHVFVFFDREGRHLQNSERDPLLNWDRWKRDVIDRQVKTARGAERYLKSGRKIFLDAAFQMPFPINIPADRMHVHKIVVAHGANEACKDFSRDNVYGSLAVSYSEVPGTSAFPFMVHLSKHDPVHILDSHNLPIVLSELDTFTDLLAYIDAKVQAISKFDLLAYCGEEDLLAHYFGSFDTVTGRHFIGPMEKDINGVLIPEGEWKEFIERPEYKRKKEADKNSYFWDEIIQRTCQNALDGTLLGDGLLKGRSALNEMAREPRLSRRALADHMVRAIRNFAETPDRITRHLSFMPSYYEDVGYVFLQLKVDGITDYDGDYRPKRQVFLDVACGAAKNKFPHLKSIVGIAIDAPKFSETNSEDFVLMDCQDWSEERRTHCERENQVFEFFASPSLQTRKLTIKNFPDPKD
jgi:hypothetical protein